MQILGHLGMYFDAVVVEVEKYVFTFFQIGSDHSVSFLAELKNKKNVI